VDGLKGFPEAFVIQTVWAFIRCRTTTPAADFCRPVRTDHSILSFQVSRSEALGPLSALVG
jgi:hypothetical protein